jgi:hypothetical protein
MENDGLFIRRAPLRYTLQRRLKQVYLDLFRVSRLLVAVPLTRRRA